MTSSEKGRKGHQTAVNPIQDFPRRMYPKNLERALRALPGIGTVDEDTVRTSTKGGDFKAHPPPLPHARASPCPERSGSGPLKTPGSISAKFRKTTLESEKTRLTWKAASGILPALTFQEKAQGKARTDDRGRKNKDRGQRKSRVPLTRAAT